MLKSHAKVGIDLDAVVSLAMVASASASNIVLAIAPTGAGRSRRPYVSALAGYKVHNCCPAGENKKTR